MKVKVKLGSQSQVIDFERLEPSAVRLEDLRQSVSRLFHLENNSDFQISLNRRDVLCGSDQTLDTFGIISGDLLYIIGSSLSPANPTRQQIHSRPQPLTSYSSPSLVQYQQLEHVVTASSNGRQTQVSTGNVTSSSDSQSGESVNGDNASRESSQMFNRNLETLPEINRFLQEPLVVRESTEHQVPVLLSQLYRSVNICNECDALWVAIHTLMLESGFLPSETRDPMIMPSDWKRQGYYSCLYDYSVTADSVDSCSVVGITLGASMIMHGLAKSNPDFRTEHLQLRCADFVKTLSQDVPATYRALDRLSRQFKDTICLPLINELFTAAGFPERQGLQALPYETKLRVISFLDPRSLCRLGQTCLEFNMLYRDKTVWRLLYIQTFGRPDDCSLSRNWYELFKKKYCLNKQMIEERMRQRFALDETDPPWGFPGSGPFRPVPFPHIIGGNYDVHPEFTSGIPNPMGGARNSGPLFPQVGIPDPFSPGLGDLGMPGRPWSNARNLTGSQFSNSFRGPFM